MVAVAALALPAETPRRCAHMFRATRKEAHDWHPGLLRARCERPRRRAAQERDEVAAFWKHGVLRISIFGIVLSTGLARLSQ
jgi:hypothetical protein